jgi:hypothetical protein
MTDFMLSLVRLKQNSEMTDDEFTNMMDVAEAEKNKEFL